MKPTATHTDTTPQGAPCAALCDVARDAAHSVTPDAQLSGAPDRVTRPAPRAATALCVVVSALVVVLSLVLMVDFSKLAPARTASSLQTVTTKTATQTRVDYVDDDGNLTVATDKGYATVVKDLDESGHNVLESYYDADGNPAKATAGQYAVRRTWSGKLNTRIDYLDADGQPTRISSGYATIERAFNASGQLAEERYLDAAGEPTCSTAGYAAKANEYNELGKVSRERYLGLDGSPAANKSGVYGMAYEYDGDGRTVRTTCLDADGQPTRNVSGYCSVARTYDSEGTLDTEMYYDENGNPVRLAGGQYGVKHVDGKTVKVDENGNQIFDVATALSSWPWVVVLVGVALVVLIAAVPRRARVVVVVLYVVFILWVTLLARQTGAARAPMAPLASYAQFLTSYQTRLEILDNIWFFIPLGAGLYALLRGRREKAKAGRGVRGEAREEKLGGGMQTEQVDGEMQKVEPSGEARKAKLGGAARKPVVAVALVVVAALALSVGIEVTQFALGLGQCEADDMINNTLGAAIGIMMVTSALAAGKAMHRRGRTAPGDAK